MRFESRPPGERRIAPYILIAPFFLLFIIFGLFPLLYTGWVSLHDWHLINGDNGFVGRDNFSLLLADPNFYNALFNTVSIFVLATVPELLAALGLAELLNRRLRGGTLWRSTVLLPNVVSVAAVALVFSQLFAEDYGFVNTILGFLGISPVDWQSDTWAAHLAIASMVAWRWTGYNALVYLAAMQSVPQELYDAAAVDGASRWRSFWSVTVPSIRPTIVFTVVVATIGGFQIFAEPQLFDAAGVSGTGGANRQFQTLAMYIYEQGFRLSDAGYAAAISWLVFGLCVVFALVNVVAMRRIPRPGL